MSLFTYHNFDEQINWDDKLISGFTSELKLNLYFTTKVVHNLNPLAKVFHNSLQNCKIEQRFRSKEFGFQEQGCQKHLLLNCFASSNFDLHLLEL